MPHARPLVPLAVPPPQAPPSPTDTGSTVLPQGSLREFKEGSERAFIVAKLRENAWNISATAQAIDTPRSNLYKKLEQYGITEETDGLTPKAPGAEGRPRSAELAGRSLRTTHRRRGKSGLHGGLK